MSSEEDFPKMFPTLLVAEEIENDEDAFWNWEFSFRTIQQSCLDKQRVREAFEKLDSELDEWTDRSGPDWAIDFLKKELGL